MRNASNVKIRFLFNAKLYAYNALEIFNFIFAQRLISIQ